jgi:hypothetical protein
MMLDLGERYRAIAEEITGAALPLGENPRQEILDVLADSLGLR